PGGTRERSPARDSYRARSPPRRDSNSSTTTFPRTQRFAPTIADLPKIIPGGQRAEPLVDETRINKLEEEAEKLRKIIEEKQSKLRKSVREWDRAVRESEAAAYRSSLAEESIRKLNGETEVQGAF
ncbi:MAG: hypothetical protein FE78DRAFT_139972, partial [Acidomyces sp. 'richmondensis']